MLRANGEWIDCINIETVRTLGVRKINYVGMNMKLNFELVNVPLSGRYVSY